MDIICAYMTLTRILSFNSDRFVDLDSPLLLSEDPIFGGYEGIFVFHLLCPFLS